MRVGADGAGKAGGSALGLHTRAGFWILKPQIESNPAQVDANIRGTGRVNNMGLTRYLLFQTQFGRVGCTFVPPLKQPRPPTEAVGGRFKQVGPDDQYMCWPPFMATLLPVMNPAASLHMNATSAATSSGWPSRPTGICGSIFSFKTSSGTACTMRVSR